ncbi:MAG: aldo/keto reductase [Lentisphaeria bacterium]|nr:aldo/keto reductase [Lentisphaeria bacterium]
MPYGIGVQHREDMLSDDEAVRLLRTAVDRGVNFFDTAPAYGESERILGLAFEEIRDQVVLCTKCPKLLNDDDTLPSGAEVKRLIEESLVASLHALRTDYVDVLMLHQVTDEVLCSDAVLSAFASLKERGLIRLAGASTYPGGITGRVVDNGRWDVIQLAMNVLDQREGEFLEKAEAAGVGVVVRSVLFKGILTDRGRTLHSALADVQNQRRLLEREAREGMSLSDLATAYAMSKRGVSSVLLGIDRMEYLDQALQAADFAPLPAKLMARCDALAFPDPELLDLPKWDRNGWLT